MSGALFIWMADWYGRTWHIFFGCLGVCIATIVTSLATNLPAFIAGRFLLSFFATCAHTSAPLYLVELAPPAYRGTIAGMYNTFYNVVCNVQHSRHGKTIHLSFVSLRAPSLRPRQYMPVTNTWSTRATWTGRSLSGFRWSAQLSSAYLSSFFPSPPDGKSPSPQAQLSISSQLDQCLTLYYRLVAKDRHAEAKNVISKYHTNGDADHPLVTLQMREMIATMDVDHVASWKDLFDLRVLVESRSSRYRLMLNIAFSWFGQFSGNK